MSRHSLFIAGLWFAILCLTAGNFFFWDTIQLSSKQASFFYDGNFSDFFLPRDINSGHPPFYGLSLAMFWAILGKTLWVSHLFNTLFVGGLIYQAQILGKYFLSSKKSFLFILILFFNPIFLGHSILVSPDNALVFLFLLAMNGILRDRKWIVVLASSFLAVLSMRGMMVVLALFISEMLWILIKERKLVLTKVLKYLPAAAAALAFLLSHYFYNRWIGFHDDSPWEESFDQVSLIGYMKNLVIIAWRLVDFGNIALVLGGAYLLYKSRFMVSHQDFFLAFIIGFSLVFIIPLAGFKYLTAHRYFMPIYALISFAFVNVVVESGRKFFGIICFFFLFLGNWWIYPISISQGWDVSLGHLPFYSLVDEMNKYIEEENIDPAKIGTEFPLKTSAAFLYLDSTLPSYREAKIGESDFVLYSKIINDYKDVDYYKLQEEYFLRKEFHFLMVDLKLYEKR